MNPFWSNIFRGAGYKDTLAYFLGTVPVFSKLKRRELAAMESIVHERHYKVDEIVFEEGDIGSGMYAIRSGQVKIYIRDDHGQELELAVLEPGDFFGEVALTTSRPRIASARTTEQSTLIGLFRADLLDVVRKQPSLAAKILLGLNRAISDRLHQCNQQLQEQQRAVPASTAEAAKT